MDPRKSVLSSLLESRAPVLMVQSSDGAEVLARKNGLTVADLFRPFADMKDVTLPIRTGTTSHSLRGLRLRVLPASELACPPWDSSEGLLSRTVAAEAADAGISVPGMAASGGKPGPGIPELTLSSTEDAARWLSKLKASDPAPWASAWRRDITPTLRCLPHDTFDCPAVILTVVSTSDPNPLQALADMIAPSSLPRPYAADMYDASGTGETGIHRVFILLSDRMAEKDGSVGLTARNAAAAVAAGGLDGCALSTEASASPPFTSPLHGSTPMSPQSLLNDMRARLPPGSTIHGAYINSRAVADVYACSPAGTTADVWSPLLTEPLCSRPAGVPFMYPHSAVEAGMGLVTPTKGPSRSALMPSSTAPLSVCDTLLRCGLVPQRGCCLTDDDVRGLRDMTRKVVQDGVIPALEARLQALARDSGKGRVGLRGKIMSFIGSVPTGAVAMGGGPRVGAVMASTGGGGGGAQADKSALSMSVTSLLGAAASPLPPSVPSVYGTQSGGFDDGPGGGAAVPYDVITVTFPSGSTYAQSRALADILLFIGDGEGAANLYRLIREDAKNGKAPGHYASACEGLALALLVKDRDSPTAVSAATPSREAESALESAVYAYARAASASGGGGGGGVGMGMGSPGQPGAGGMGSGSGYVSVQLGGVSSPVVTQVEAQGPPSSSSAHVARRIALRLSTRAALALAELQVTCSTAMLAGIGGAAGTGGGKGEAGGAAPASTVAHANARIKDAAALLRRAAQAEGEGSLAAALLTEAAGLACLRMSPPAHRRAAYHLATAGALYGSVGPAFAGLAVRCLLSASSAVGDAPTAALAPRTGASLTQDGAPLGWALISDHLCLNAAQRLLQLGNAEAASYALCFALTTSAARLSPAVQRNMIRELVRAHSAAQRGKRASHAKAAADRWMKKEKAGALPASASLLDASAGAWMGRDREADFALGYAALAEALPADTLAAILADADKASEAVCPGLPVFDDGSVRVVSWGNAWSARAAVEHVCTAAGPNCGGSGVDREVSSSTPLLPPSLTRPLPTLSLWSTDASSSALAATSEDLLSMGIGDGSVPGEGMWTGHLPGEGPVCPGETISGPGRQVWIRMLEAFTRDLKIRDKVGGAAILATTATGDTTTPCSGTATDGSPFDWRRVCTDIAIAAEDEAEMAAKSHKTCAEDAGHQGGEGGGGDGEAASLCSSLPATALAPFMSLPVIKDGVEEVGTGGSTLAGDLDRIDESDECIPGGPTASTLLGASGLVKGGSAGSQSQRHHAAELVSKPLDRFAGEPFAVVVSVTNPTGVDLCLSDMCLVGVVNDPLTDESVAANVSGGGGQGWAVHDSPSRHFATLGVDCSLSPGETRAVYLLGVATAPGTLCISGVSWRLLPSPASAKTERAPALPRYRHDFELRGPPLNDSKATKASGARAADKRLEARVKAPREWAGVRVDGLGSSPSWAVGGADALSVMAPPPSSSVHGTPLPPPTPCYLPLARTVSLWEGETRPLTVSLYNAGRADISSVWVRGTGGGNIVLAGQDGALEGLEGASLCLAIEDAHVSGGTGGERTLPMHTVLRPGATATWTLHVQAVTAGCHALRMLILYSALPRTALSARALSSGAVRTVRWSARLRVLPCVATIATLSPCKREAGMYSLAVHMANVCPPAAGARLPTGGGASPVSLPVIIRAVRLVSDRWEAELEGVEQRSMAPDMAQAQGSGADLAAALSAPLPYLAVRTLTYRVRPAGQPHPTRLLLPSGAVQTLAGGVRGVTPVRTALTGMDVGRTALLRAGHGQASVSRLVASARAREHARRRAAEAADALPPTLRSIRLAKGGVGVGGGEGQDSVAADEEEAEAVRAEHLPSSLHALCGGRTRIGLLLTWERPGSVMSAVGGDGIECSASGFLHVASIEVGSCSVVCGSAGSAPRPLLSQLAAAAAVATSHRGGAPPPKQGAGTVRPALAPSPVGPYASGPFGPATSDQTPPTTLPPRRTRPGDALRLARPALPLTTSLEGPLPLALGQEGACSFNLVLYHSGAPGSGAMDLQLAMLTAGHTGADSTGGALLHVPAGWAVASSAVDRPFVWCGPSLRALPPLLPGHRLVVSLAAHAQAYGEGGRRDRVQAEAQATLAIRRRHVAQAGAEAPWLSLV